MTLRDWVEENVDVIGTRAELEAFETEILSAQCYALETGKPSKIPADLDEHPCAWLLTFYRVRAIMLLLGAPLGQREA